MWSPSWHLLAIVFTLSTSLLASAAGTLTQISSDPYHNKTSQHLTELEPDNFGWGHTIVSAFQVGRFWNGGASNIGWATSHDGGTTFKHGFLPGTTIFATPQGPYNRASDASVAYDAKHGVWMISWLGLFPHGNFSRVDVLVSRSTNGGLTWGMPVVVDKGDFDKNWTTCDDFSSSPHFGNCYTEFDNPANGDQIQMSTSTDSGKTWGPAKTTANGDFGIAGQPLVQPNGRVIVPIIGFVNNNSQPFNMKSFISKDGGASWSKTFLVSEVDFRVPQGIRSTIPLPSAEIDASGKVYVTWEDCRFENGCRANDIVITTTNDGVTYSKVQRVPIDRVGSLVDHFIPGLGVDRSTSGSSAHLALAYYYYPVANCQTLTCRLDVGFISSTNGGASWSASQRVTPSPMRLQWLALTTQGYMVGDYISTVVLPGDSDAYPVVAVASPPTGTGQTCNAAGTVCHEAIFSVDVHPFTGGTNPLGNDKVYAPPVRPIHVTRTAF